MEENTVLSAFVALSALLPMAFVRFYRTFKQRQKNLVWPWIIAGNLLVFLFLCSVVLLGGELYFRFYFDTTDSFGLTKTTARWFERHFHNNNIGFRDSQNYVGTVVPGNRRVTFIGDSFTAGHGVPNVEDRFANRIRSVDPHIEVHVLAECGWDTGPELSHVDSITQTNYQWDLAVLVYCLNDIADIVPEWMDILQRVYHTTDPSYFIEHSYFLNALYFRWQASRDPDVANYYHFVKKNYQGPIWEEQKHRLKSLRDKIASRGGKLVVVTFPFLHALGPDYEYQFIHETLDEYWRELGVPHLDLLSLYQSSNPDDLVVNAYDAHPNERAHKMAAELIAKFLTKHLE